MTAATLFTRCGRALFGDRWKADMAHALNAELARAGEVRRVTVDRVDDWSKGRGKPPPPGVWRTLAALIQDRREAMAPLHADVLIAAAASAPPAGPSS